MFAERLAFGLGDGRVSVATGVALSLPGLPLDWYGSSGSSNGSGSTRRPNAWWVDRLKGFCCWMALRLSVAGVIVETGRVDGTLVVVVGLGALLAFLQLLMCFWHRS